MITNNPPAVQVYPRKLEEYVQGVCQQDGLEYDIFFAYQVETFRKPHQTLDEKGIELNRPHHILRYIYSNYPREHRFTIGGQTKGEILLHEGIYPGRDNNLSYPYTQLLKKLEPEGYFVKLLTGCGHKGLHFTSKVEPIFSEESRWLLSVTEYHNRIVLLNRAFRETSQAFEQSLKLGGREK